MSDCRPARAEFRELTRTHSIVPVWREVVADCQTPVAAFLRLEAGLRDAFLLESVCPGKSFTLPAGFAEKHAKENNGSDDASQFCTKSEYLDLIRKMQASLKSALADVSESQLDEPAPERFRSFFPTVGNMYLLIANHLLMHAGQIAVVRRQLGKPVVI